MRTAATEERPNEDGNDGSERESDGNHYKVRKDEDEWIQFKAEAFDLYREKIDTFIEELPSAWWSPYISASFRSKWKPLHRKFGHSEMEMLQEGKEKVKRKEESWQVRRTEWMAELELGTKGNYDSHSEKIGRRIS